jgi:hypothetical protein
MMAIRLKLFLDGADKTYEARISARVSLRAFELQEAIARRYGVNIVALSAVVEAGDETGEAPETEARREAAKFLEAEALYDAEQREELLQFVVDLFGGQFTREEFLDGFQDSFFAGVPAILRAVVDGINAKVRAFPNVEAGPGEEKP